jgi:cysteine desulfurase
MRSGTENVPGACAFAEAARIACESFDARIEKILAVRTQLLSRLAADEVLQTAVTPNLPEVAAPHILSLTVNGFKSETVLNDLSGRGIYVSSGSACASHARNLSQALLAFGKTEAETDATVRLSFSHHNTVEEADAFLGALRDIVETRAKAHR